MNQPFNVLAQGEITELVKTVRWRPSTNGEEQGVEVDVDVYRLPSGKYQASPSHKVKGPGQASGYHSIDPKDTPEEAIKSCIDGYLPFMGSPDETEWIRIR